MKERTSAIAVVTAAVAWLATLICPASSLSLRVTVSRSTIELGGSSQIDCVFEPPATYIFWRYSANGGATWDKLALCHADSGKCSLQDQFKNWTDRMTTLVNGSLAVWNASRDQDGQYECEGIKNTDAAKDNRSITIVTPPERPQLFVSADTVTEGNLLNVTCQSAGGNPPPAFQWFVRRFRQSDYAPLPAASPGAERWLAPRHKFGVAASEATLRMSASDNLAAVVCRTVHPTGNLSSSELVFTVLYTPKLSPVESQRVILGDSASVNCSADGNPPARISLLKDNVTLSDTSQQSLRYSVASVARGQAGSYACQAANPVGTAFSAFQLDVLFSPAVEVPGALVVREGSRLDIACSVEANPMPYTVNWRHPRSGRLLGNSSRLLLPSAARTDAGEWACEAQNLMSPTAAAARTGRGSSSVQVTVQYSPGMPIIVVGPTSDTSASAAVLSGRRVTLECRFNPLSPGVPAPSLAWNKAGRATPLASGPMLTLESAELADSGEYVCTPENSIGRGPAASVSLTVEQSPRWVAAPGEAVSGSTVSVAATAGRTDVALVCTVQGRPACQIAWFKDGRELNAADYSAGAEFDPALFITRNTLRFSGPGRSGLRPDDNGVYQCVAQNGYGKIVRSYQLSVEFAPIILTNTTMIAFDPDAIEMSLECPMLSQPEPTVTWELGDASHLGNLIRDSAISYRYRATLLGIRALGRYTCVARSRLGEARHAFDIVPRGPPAAPTSLRVATDVGWDHAALAWQPGFDGGLPATLWARCQPPPEGRSTGEAIRVDGPSGTNLTGLAPDTNYTVQVFAVNQVGAGPSSAELSLRTQALPMPTVTGVRRDGSALVYSGPPGYCLRVDARRPAAGQTEQQQWAQLQQCVPSDQGRLAGLDFSLVYRLMLCLVERKSVCGPAVTTANLSSFPEVSTFTIAIVASVCTVLIIGLIALLVFFCCRNRSLTKEASPTADSPDDEEGQRQLEPDLMASTYKSYSSKPYAMVSPHPSLTSTDETSIEQTNKVFSTLLSANHPIAGNNNLECGSDNSGTFLHPARQRKVIYEVVV